MKNVSVPLVSATFEKRLRLETARRRFCEICAQVRCFHPLISFDLTSASAQVSQTLLQDSSLICSVDMKTGGKVLLSFFVLRATYSQNLRLCQAGQTQDGDRLIQASSALWLSR